MGQYDDRQLVKQVIQRLKRDKRGFGKRPWSFYSPKDPEPFVSYVLGLDAVRDLLPYDHTGDLRRDLTEEGQQRLKELVDRVDHYGTLVTGWRRGCAVSQSGLADLEARLQFWTLRNMPQHCSGQVHLQQVVDALVNALKANIRSYTYTEDLLLWAIPYLVRTLRAQVEEFTHEVRTGLDLVHLREQLQAEALRILNHMSQTYGIHGIEVEEVTERALHHVLCAGDADYSAHQDRVVEWATDKLKGQIKLQIPSYVAPDMGPDWYCDPGTEDWELQKRQRLLEVFFSAVRGER